MTARSQYRSDIDGLRAIAVLSVTLFHLSRPLVPNGYLGVDVFFVISGYLLTGIIWAEMHDGAFSILTFYKRRIRRILPALMVFLLIVSAASSVILLPTDLIGYARSLLASLVFVPNIYFWRDTDYFARAAEDKPLLNLWSLGVEEQFYIVVPLLLLLLLRFMPRQATRMIWLLVLLSFCSNWFLNGAGGASPAFYLLPTRAWELGLGSAFAMTRHRPGSPLWAWAGLAMILVALVVPMPRLGGLPAGTLAVLGTGLVLWKGMSATDLAGRLLASGPFAFFGKISYSLYLWHWPLIVLASYRLVRPPSPLELAAIGLVSVVAGWLSWRYVETPFRRRTTPFPIVGWSVLSGALAVTVVGLGLLQSGGLPGRLSAEAARINAAVGTHYRCEVTRLFSFGASRACDLTLDARGIDGAEIVLLGNSHAQMYAPLVRDWAEAHGVSAVLVPLNGCLPTTTLNIGPGCLQMARKNLDAVRRLPAVRLFIVAQSWPTETLYDAEGTPVAAPDEPAQADATVSLARELAGNGAKVLLVGPLAVPGADIASIASREAAYGLPQTAPWQQDRAVWEDRFALAVQRLEASGFGVIRPDTVQCAGRSCTFIDAAGSIFADDNHVARAALPRFAPLFDAALDAAAPPK